MRKILPLLILFVAAQAYPGSSTGFIQQNSVAIADLGAWPDGAFPLVSPYRVIFIGENHGSAEPPAAVAGLTHLLQAHGKKVAVALEIWATEQPTIDSYLKTGDRALLTAAPFFNQKNQDGRESSAMVTLLDSLRAIGDVPVICFDPDSPDNQLRNTGMGFALADAAAKYPDRAIVVLTGNYHSRVTQVQLQTPPYETFFPAGYEVSHLDGSGLKASDVMAFIVRDEGGSAWNCLLGKNSQEDCGVHTWPDQHSSYSDAVTSEAYLLRDSAIFDGHPGTLFIRHLTAALPLVPVAHL